MTGRELGDQPADAGIVGQEGHGHYIYRSTPAGDAWIQYAPGMTIRQRMAMRVAQGLVANPSIIDGINASTKAWLVANAVEVTDALLSELAKERP